MPTTVPPIVAPREREDFDRLLDAAVARVLSTSESSDRETSERLAEDAALLRSDAEAFADQVDRHNDGRADDVRIPYGEAVLLDGSHRVLVVRWVEYDREPVFWDSLAGGDVSRVVGPDLLRALNG